MDLAFVEEMFAGLSEPQLPVGGIFEADDGSMTVPFLCETHRFLGMFVPAHPHSVDGQTLIRHVGAETGHLVSPNAHFFKFYALDRFLSEGDNFAPLTADSPIRLSIRRQMPDLLAALVRYFLGQMQAVDEIYFLPAGDNARRVHALNLWYKRIADTIAVEKLGLLRIHLVNGDYWYGYRKA